MSGSEWAIVIACWWLGFNFLFLALMLLRFFLVTAREEREREAENSIALREAA